MPLMIVFEPLFLVLALVTVVLLLASGVAVLRGQYGRAMRILKRVGLGAVLYFGAVIVTSVVQPQRVYHLGDRQCFDDWCVEVVGGHWNGEPPSEYEATLRLINRARRVPMGEKGTVVYLTDSGGHRYDPLPAAGEAAFDTILQPGASVTTVRRFDVPPGAQGLSLIYTHQGGFPIGWLIIGEGGWFQKPAVVRLESSRTNRASRPPDGATAKPAEGRSTSPV